MRRNERNGRRLVKFACTCGERYRLLVAEGEGEAFRCRSCRQEIMLPALDAIAPAAGEGEEEGREGAPAPATPAPRPAASSGRAAGVQGRLGDAVAPRLDTEALLREAMESDLLVRARAFAARAREEVTSARERAAEAEARAELAEISRAAAEQEIDRLRARVAELDGALDRQADQLEEQEETLRSLRPLLSDRLEADARRDRQAEIQARVPHDRIDVTGMFTRAAALRCVEDYSSDPALWTIGLTDE